MKKQSLIVAAAIAGTLSSSMAFADVSANVGVASTYLWRGFNLSGTAPAVSGGVDYSHDSGAYVGVWQSSEGVAGSPETDVYFGFAGEAGDISYDVGYISYMYEQVAAPAADPGFEEIYVSAGFKGISFGYNLGQDTALDYLSLGYEYDIYSITYGDYDTAGSHIDLGVALGDEVSMTYSMPSDTTVDDDAILVVSWGKSFDL